MPPHHSSRQQQIAVLSKQNRPRTRELLPGRISGNSRSRPPFAFPGMAAKPASTLLPLIYSWTTLRD